MNCVQGGVISGDYHLTAGPQSRPLNPLEEKLIKEAEVDARMRAVVPAFMMR